MTMKSLPLPTPAPNDLCLCLACGDRVAPEDSLNPRQARVSEKVGRRLRIHVRVHKNVQPVEANKRSVCDAGYEIRSADFRNFFSDEP